MQFICLILFIIPALCITSSSNAQQNVSGNEATTLLTDSLQEKVLVFDSAACGLRLAPAKSYAEVKAGIKAMKLKLKEKYLSITDSTAKRIFLDSAMNVFTYHLLNEVIPAWYGTAWDFNGYTSKPNEGVIACGYFVSTTLSHMGMNLNRYTLAQQSPPNEAKSIAIADENLIFETSLIYYTEVFEKLNAFSPGLYFAGLDNHVGFLYIKEGVKYFIDANYIDGKVKIDIAENSLAFRSGNYYFSKISGNLPLALKWLMETEVKIVTR